MSQAAPDLKERVVSAPEVVDLQHRKNPATKVLNDKEVVFQRRVMLLATAVPFAGFAIAVWSLWGRGLSPVDVGIFLGMWIFTGLGVTVGYHRLFTHKSFEARPLLRSALAVAGSMSIEGSVISWVAAHRRHHAFSDKDGDPHSPHLDSGPGIAGVARGLWHAHIGWLFDREQTHVKRWAPDLLREPAIHRIDRLFPLLAVISFTLPLFLGLAITRSVEGAVTAFVWGGLARIFFLHHVTWSINSICHFYGNRPFETTDHSTNNWPLSLLSFGESWHNNHHAFPSSAVHGLGRWQIDISAATIRLFERLGWAYDVKTVSRKQLEAKQF